MKEECIIISSADSDGRLENLKQLEMLEDMHLVVESSLANLPKEDSDRYAKGVFLDSTPGYPDRKSLNKLMEVLKSGAPLSIHLMEVPTAVDSERRNGIKNPGPDEQG